MEELMPIERAQLHLDAWYKAELAVSTGQSYTIGSRSLTRANLKEIRGQIAYWEKRIGAMQGVRRRRAKRFIPRDL